MSQLCSETDQSDGQVQGSAPSNRRPLIVGRCVVRQAPWGWTFVAIGIPALTNRCLSLSQDEGLEVEVVSLGPNTAPHQNPENLAYHLHRAGYHIHNSIVKKAMEELHLISRDDQAPSGNDHANMEPHALVRPLDLYLRQHGLAPGQMPVPFPKQTDVSNLIQDLFPKMPQADQDEVLGRAFGKGPEGVIGCCSSMSLARRVQLAVAAHIRHRKTDYDLQMKRNHSKRVEIREGTEPILVDYIKKWRGEDTPEPEEDYEYYEGYEDYEDYGEEDYGNYGEEEDDDAGGNVPDSKRGHRSADRNEYDWKPPADVKECIARYTPAWVRPPHEGFHVQKDKDGNPIWPNKIVFDD